MNRLALFLALCGSLLVAAAAGLVFYPLGLAVLGVELLTVAYMIQYLGARR